ncbi:hypothetical protein [Pseudolabrys sp. FHR47]|uniref:hypothetical protein n=1 Tax=Pseudolabrys sp. FHR47 TaxID=2562284 RepID=UPI0010BE4011|nr:hypothetical protein [Pseudolabrys sp. FHR47]
MTHVRKGQLTAIKEWRKHLREWKQVFWKAERKEAQRQARREASEMTKARPPRRAFDFGAWPHAPFRHGRAKLRSLSNTLRAGLSRPSWPGLSRPSTSF